MALTLQEVTFRYPQQPSPALENISLQIAAGEHIAILGRTGCGKIDAVAVAYPRLGPVTGEILLQQSAALRPQRSHSGGRQ
ncbi:ATP-binding cassette domain-containing protein [Klebsiella pneumoniae subsp. pneumoniae]|nr:ATP-binding cassette domain-containing protein [Klebsiella pneumoniae subsp. pneumoniae]